MDDRQLSWDDLAECNHQLELRLEEREREVERMNDVIEELYEEND